MGLIALGGGAVVARRAAGYVNPFVRVDLVGTPAAGVFPLPGWRDRFLDTRVRSGKHWSLSAAVLRAARAGYAVSTALEWGRWVVLGSPGDPGPVVCDVGTAAGLSGRR